MFAVDGARVKHAEREFRSVVAMTAEKGIVSVWQEEE
jgi:hypothetical protein